MRMKTVRGRLVGAVVLATLLSASLAIPASAVEDETAAGFETVLRGTNDYRESNGVERLVHDPRLSAVAQAWAEKMAADYAVSRDTNQAFRHNPKMSSQVPAGWESVGENIGLNGGYDDPYAKLVGQWRTSPGHSANMLNARWTHIGIGTYTDDFGLTWGVQVFGDYGTPTSIPDPITVTIDLDNFPSPGTIGCAVLVSEPAGTDFFRQCGTRSGNAYVFSDVPSGSYSATLTSSSGGVLYSRWPTGGGTAPVTDTGTTGLASFSDGITRLYGDSRYETAIQVSRQFPPGVSAVFVASGSNFPDALSAAAAAASMGGPLLLTSPTAIPADVIAEIRRLDPDRIYIAGGTGAVSASVAKTLATIAPVTRYGGTNRYATGLQIVAGVFDKSSTAILASGRAFPDALAATGVAGKLGAPVILVDGVQSTIPSNTLNELIRLGVKDVIIAGGPGAVSAGIEKQLANRGYSVKRYGGADRYSTAALINNAYFSASSTDTILLANGANFPDGLAGAALAGRIGAPLYTTPAACAPASIRNSVENLGISKKIVLGGPTVLSLNAANNGVCAR